jgi:hypothetical protein
MRNHNIYFLDWKNAQSDQRYFDLASRYPNVYKVNVQDSLSASIRTLSKLTDRNYFWMVNSLTDYSNFQFENHSEKGLEPYLQVFGANTWLASGHHIGMVPETLNYIEEFPDQHFVNTDLKFDSQLLDIVYISNGEPLAEKHYQHLVKTVKTGNKIHRIDGINGRTEAYKAAANASNSAWFFAVFAKIEVNPEFDWSWKPDSLKGPMHYIFHAHNPVVGIEYGHMAVIAYNKSTTLSTEHTGLDFVMTRPHTVIPTLSGTAHYNQDPITTWRTAFREAIKLKHNGGLGEKYRLQQWLTETNGNFGEWSSKGAIDGLEYYNSTNGDFEKLMLSYDWNWLNQYFQNKYNL